MNQSVSRYIGINQRVPFAVLEQGIRQFLLEGSVDRAAIRMHLAEFTEGENRLKKAVAYAYAILTRPSHLLINLRRQFSAEAFGQLPLPERQAFCLSLLACTYPIAYDLSVAFATGFKVQPQISRQYITNRITAQYGSARTIDIAIDALLPMLIELGVIERVEVSVYTHRPVQEISHKFIAESYVYTDLRCSRSKSLLLLEVNSRPWYLYYTPLIKLTPSLSTLKITESSIGGGYISMK